MTKNSTCIDVTYGGQRVRAVQVKLHSPGLKRCASDCRFERPCYCASLNPTQRGASRTGRVTLTLKAPWKVTCFILYPLTGYSYPAIHFDLITGFSDFFSSCLPVSTTERKSGLHHPSAPSIPINQPGIYTVQTQSS